MLIICENTLFISQKKYINEKKYLLLNISQKKQALINNNQNLFKFYRNISAIIL